MTTVETIDFDQVFGEIAERLERDHERRIKPPLVQIWDGNWQLVGEVHNEISAKFTLPENETGVGTIELPSHYYLSRWLTDHDARSTANVFITVDKDGSRWGGMLDDLEGFKDDTGRRIVRATFKSDYEHLKHILAYSNPFLPPEIQFPRLWILFGPAKWCLKLTLFLNILRLEGNLWTLPDDPLDPSQWFNLNQSTWSQVVTPLDIGSDNSQFAIVHSRFKYMHDVQKRITADAQLTWEPRRWLQGDPPPWPGANLRHGTLVWDLVDNSGWDTETSFGGNIFDGLIRAFTSIGSDGMTQGIDVIEDPTFPAEYGQPGWYGTLPSAPGIILRDGDRTGIQSNSFHWKPATDTEFVTGGHSMPGVNEAIGAAINMLGDLIAAALFVPPIGGMLDTLLKPLYCVAGDTLIDGPDGKERIDVLAARGDPFRVWSLTPRGDRVASVAEFAFKKGRAELFEYTLANGRKLTATAHHRWLTRAGWTEAAQTPIGSDVATVDDRSEATNVPAPERDLPDSDWSAVDNGRAVAYVPLVSIKSVGVQDFYDMHVPGWVNYSGGGIWNHNTDVFLAFMKWQDIGRAQRLGWSHYQETWCEGSDRAYTLSALIALRTGMWRTREQTTHTVTVADGVENLRIGQRGRGNAYLGTRIGTTVQDWGPPGKVYVDRITELTLSWDRKTTPRWDITVGHREPEDPVQKALEMLQEVMSIARDLGVL
ncbi:hypothetical protein [Nocardia brasiliensis]|uniref:Gp37-like protein n=1 Tax=Nocardia brasiliensis TaxID=37326 RepID=UPI002454C632|nr:hypothetical protein [Nocardia brasiliensis]